MMWRVGYRKACTPLLKKMTSKEELAVKKKKGHLGLSNSFHYTLMVLPGYIWLFMFSIVPMVGIVMAFQDYNPSKDGSALRG